MKLEEDKSNKNLNENGDLSDLEFIVIDSLEKFVCYQNNFFSYFLDNCEWGKMKRSKGYFKEFQNLYPEIEKELTNIVVESRINSQKELPYEKLFEAYNLMKEILKKEGDIEEKNISYLLFR